MYEQETVIIETIAMLMNVFALVNLNLTLPKRVRMRSGVVNSSTLYQVTTLTNEEVQQQPRIDQRTGLGYRRWQAKSPLSDTIRQSNFI